MLSRGLRHSVKRETWEDLDYPIMQVHRIFRSRNDARDGRTVKIQKVTTCCEVFGIRLKNSKHR